ncbi:uncharacterized protein LOC127703909 [Mytilus californianus]|uniref:uncharacterized protein LOC127703909 n=1 Tax=Mytilus californianus TaxID=6549 RepID=UPI00224713FB|nr:uncharacterized protein LOC127703909 [Mytilus californianus]
MATSGDGEEEGRTKHLTPKAYEQYLGEVDKYSQALATLSRENDRLISILLSNEARHEEIASAAAQLEETTNKYINLSDCYIDYLKRKNTLDSQRELIAHQLIRSVNMHKTETAMNYSLSKLKPHEPTQAFIQTGEQVKKDTTTPVTDVQMKQELKKEPNVSNSVRSHRSSTSRRSGRSNASSTMMRQKANLEAARKRLEYVDQESTLVQQKAQLEANTTLEKAKLEKMTKELEAKRDVAVAEAELHAMEEVFDESDRETEVSSPSLTEQRTAKYIIEQSKHVNRQYEVHNSAAVNNIDTQTSLHNEENMNEETPVHYSAPAVNNIDTQTFLRNDEHMNEELPIQRTGKIASQVSSANQIVQQIHKETIEQIPDTNNNRTLSLNYGQELSKFLMKKDLIISRLLKYDDRPENYLSWKDTFKCVMSEIDASPAEEIDLMIKWLGPDSSRQINSIKISNSGNPTVALSRAWNRLVLRYGCPEMIESALQKKLQAFPKITYKDKKKLFELSDVLSEIRSVKEKQEYAALLAYFDTSVGVNPTIVKLPINLQTKWRDRAVTYKRIHSVLYPPFTYFCDFINDMASTINDPRFIFESDTYVAPKNEDKPFKTRQFAVKKTNVSQDKHEPHANENSKMRCAIHNSDHLLDECRAFRHMSIVDRRALLKKNGLCFKCCVGRHIFRNCDKNVLCSECKSTDHTAAMHIYASQDRVQKPNNSQGGESSVNSKCTQICGNTFAGKSCAKIVLVNVRHTTMDKQPIRTYAIIDEQSNCSLARKELLDYFEVNTEPEQYSLASCSGQFTMTGRRTKGFIIESLEDNYCIDLPTLIECDSIPNNRQEIPTNEIAQAHPHLQSIAHMIPHLDKDAEILLLIGRDAVEAHHILEQRLGSHNQPFAQKLKMGWVIVGETCLDGAHYPSTVNAMKTFVQQDGRPSIFEPCDNSIHISEKLSTSLFKLEPDDNRQGMSIEDKKFMRLMSDEIQQDENQNWTAPLPFKKSRLLLPNNRLQALNRARAFDISLRKDPVKKQHVLDFMKTLFDNNHAERAQNTETPKEMWYLPMFGVYHPKKKDRIRVVFDSSAKFQGTSLNDVLMTGPNLVNSLLGVLLRFRKDKIAITADIRQMFYSFNVTPEHRDFLRFIWHEGNDMEKDLVDYRMAVHVFGNSPSPAVATFGLRKTAEMAESKYGSDVVTYVNNNFYVDDALSSHSNSDKAVDLLKRTQSALQEFGNLRLHKISSNSNEVLAAFEKDDLSEDLKNLDFSDDCLPVQRSLGVSWNLQSDNFTFQVSLDNKPFTRRGVLSVINGLYDPLGFAAPVTIAGKLILRETMKESTEWDEPLPPQFQSKWQSWKDSLQLLQQVEIPRNYSSDWTLNKDLCIFSDSSEKAVAAVAYIRTTDKNGTTHLGFVLGKATRDC